MTEMEFSAFWQKSHAFFGIDAGTKSKLASYNATFDEVKGIPAEVLEAALNRIKDMDSMPRNIIKQIRFAWFEWKAKNPKRLISDTVNTNGCPCCDKGYIWVEKRKPGLPPDTAVYRCGDCGGGEGDIPVAARSALESWGWTVTCPKQVKQPDKVTPLPVEQNRKSAASCRWILDALAGKKRSPEQKEQRMHVVHSR